MLARVATTAAAVAAVAAAVPAKCISKSAWRRRGSFESILQLTGSRLFALQHVVVSAEAAKAVSQHGQGLVKLPGDMQQTLEGYLKGTC